MEMLYEINRELYLEKNTKQKKTIDIKKWRENEKKNNLILIISVATVRICAFKCFIIIHYNCK